MRSTGFIFGGITLTTLVTALVGCATDTRALHASEKVLVAGATGGTGREVVYQALDMGYQVRVLVRDEAKAQPLFGKRVTYVVGNVRDPATLTAAVEGVDYVVSALGSNVSREPENKPEFIDYGGVKSLADAARAADVKQFVLVSSMGVTDPEHMLNKILDNILVWKLRGEEALRASGLVYTIVRPGGLRDGPAGIGGVRLMQGDPKNMVGQIARADVAAICVHALGDDATYRTTFEVVGNPDGASPDWQTVFDKLQPDER